MLIIDDMNRDLKEFIERIIDLQNTNLHCIG